MKRFAEYIDEMLAVIIVIGCIVLMLCHIDGEVKSILTIATGWVFGKRVALRKRK